MASEPTVFVVDDEPEMRHALRRTFKRAGIKVETYASGQEFMAAYKSDIVGCLLLDIQMPGENGLDLQKALTARGNQTPIIFLTGAGDVPSAVDAFKQGAIDFIEKPAQKDVLLNRVKAAIELDLQAQHERFQCSEIKQRYELLTPREREVMKWIIDGKSNKIIARLLDISSRTVEIHRRRVINKMQAKSVADLVQMSLKAQV